MTPPFVLHYHNEIDAAASSSGRATAVLNPLIDAFNRARADTTGLAYAGLPEPPLARRVLRRWRAAAGTSDGPVAAVRRHRLLPRSAGRPSGSPGAAGG